MAVNALALKHQAISIHNTDLISTVLQQFHKNVFNKEILRTKQSFCRIYIKKQLLKGSGSVDIVLCGREKTALGAAVARSNISLAIYIHQVRLARMETNASSLLGIYPTTCIFWQYFHHNNRFFINGLQYIFLHYHMCIFLVFENLSLYVSNNSYLFLSKISINL